QITFAFRVQAPLQAKNICPSRRPAGLSFSFALRFVQFSRNDRAAWMQGISFSHQLVSRKQLLYISITSFRCQLFFSCPSRPNRSFEQRRYLLYHLKNKNAIPFLFFFCDAAAPLLPSTHDGNTTPVALATRFPKTDEYTQQQAHTFQ
ncbi:hypothetical protein P9711_16755, partial [Anoxybacillus geothermalis]|nr:hypothetical protein [Anoxybacillus geothermalis]